MKKKKKNAGIAKAKSKIQDLHLGVFHHQD
jgi:hypothetical protein